MITPEAKNLLDKVCSSKVQQIGHFQSMNGVKIIKVMTQQKEQNYLEALSFISELEEYGFIEEGSNANNLVVYNVSRKGVLEISRKKIIKS
jgi:hypothetical protein